MHKDTGMMLIVDDEKPIRTSISRKLRAQGYNCATAADGEKALQKAATQDFDLVLLSIKLPGISMMDIPARLISSHPDIVVVMISETAHPQTAVQALDIGGYHYVTKPFDLDDLSVRVDEVLERKRSISGKKKASASAAS